MPINYRPALELGWILFSRFILISWLREDREQSQYRDSPCCSPPATKRILRLGWDLITLIGADVDRLIPQKFHSSTLWWKWGFQNAEEFRSLGVRQPLPVQLRRARIRHPGKHRRFWWENKILPISITILLFTKRRAKRLFFYHICAPKDQNGCPQLCRALKRVAQIRQCKNN